MNHDNVQRQRLSLARMRQTHPGMVLLAWIPLQGPNHGLSPGVPPRGPDDWFGRNVQGEYFSPHWGGPWMNPWVQDYVWPRHVVRYVEQIGLGPGMLQRRFAHGRVIVNPTEQAVPVTFPEPLRDASSGALGLDTIIPPRDARLLVRPAQPPCRNGEPPF